jgi:hypothetical protein
LEVRRGVHSGETCGRKFLSDAGAVAVHLIGSLLATGGAISILCRPPSRPALSWQQLIALALSYVLVAACLYALVVWTLCNLLC